MIRGRITWIPFEARGAGLWPSITSGSPRAKGDGADARSRHRSRIRGGMPDSSAAAAEEEEGGRAVIARSYVRLGNQLAAIAAERHEDECRSIAGRMERATGHAVSHREISSYLSGEGLPSPKFMRAFANAFSLTTEERRRLAWMYTFSRLPD